ncbi:MAG: 8-amino-7-oxononanoate synthase [Candidatus Lightella neohaematopini]|nr:8-amino-7-oxononanoate synthase [Candidatus Lightella neohaematopini]MCV2528719.1 8-amino-7-oxononanoate synthase [Candidatus Lightella neohaematopini]
MNKNRYLIIINTMMHQYNSNWLNKFNEVISKRKKILTYRYRQAITNSNARLITFLNKKYINFSSNDYLGLANHPKVISSYQNEAKISGTSTSSSGHIIGYSIKHKILEKKLANLLDYPNAILFNSGFDANQAIISTIIGKNDCVITDRLIHASIISAVIQSSGTFKRFSHNNIISLVKILKTTNKYNNRLIITEGVFSMDGDQSPLNDIMMYAKATNSWVMVDDAHGFGVLGKNGKGSAYLKNCKPEILVITFSKAIGVNGAAVLCKYKILADYLIQCARQLIYSTSLSISQINAIDTAISIMQESNCLRRRLRNNIKRFKNGAKKLGLTLIPSNTAIQSITFNNIEHVLSLVKKARNHGIWLNAIRPPTVPMLSSRIRITLTAMHRKCDIDNLLQLLSLY